MSRRQRFAPHFEVLEARALPSIFSVLNLADSDGESVGPRAIDRDITSQLSRIIINSTSTGQALPTPEGNSRKS